MKTELTPWEKVAEMGRRGRDMEGRLIPPETPESTEARGLAMEAMVIARSREELRPEPPDWADRAAEEYWRELGWNEAKHGRSGATQRGLNKIAAVMRKHGQAKDGAP